MGPTGRTRQRQRRGTSPGRGDCKFPEVKGIISGKGGTTRREACLLSFHRRMLGNHGARRARRPSLGRTRGALHPFKKIRCRQQPSSEGYCCAKEDNVGGDGGTHVRARNPTKEWFDERAGARILKLVRVGDRKLELPGHVVRGTEGEAVLDQ